MMMTYENLNKQYHASASLKLVSEPRKIYFLKETEKINLCNDAFSDVLEAVKAQRERKLEIDELM